MAELSLGRLIHDLPDRIEKDKYILSYEAFTSYFQPATKDLSEEDILRGLGFVYSWMPRVFNFRQEYLWDLTTDINDHRKNSNDSIDESLIKNAVRFTCDSVVGASKLLHFIFPEVYPIYDSHIRRYLKDLDGGDKKINHHEMKKINLYVEYVQQIDKLQHDPLMKQLAEKMKPMGDVSKVRILEAAIFLASKNKFGTKQTAPD